MNYNLYKLIKLNNINQLIEWRNKMKFVTFVVAMKKK